MASLEIRPFPIASPNKAQSSFGAFGRTGSRSFVLRPREGGRNNGAPSGLSLTWRGGSPSSPGWGTLLTPRPCPFWRNKANFLRGEVISEPQKTKVLDFAKFSPHFRANESTHDAPHRRGHELRRAPLWGANLDYYTPFLRGGWGEHKLYSNM